MASPNVPELLAEAQQSAFGRGTETVVDTAVRNSLEIPASKLNGETLAKIAKFIDLRHFAPKTKLEVCPYKLVIYQEGGHFDPHRDAVRGDNYIGTLVVTLNSEYTGGELEISHASKTEVVTGPYSWVAMYGDCLHKINPVTSGTRVSLIYDLYAAGADDDEYEEFFDNERSEKDIAPEKVRSLSERHQQMIFDAVESELAGSTDTVVICLAHMYPTRQSTPYFLKGGDLALYELLRDCYDVSVEPVSVYTTISGYKREGYINAAMAKDVEARVQKRGKVNTETTRAPKVKFVIPSNLIAGLLPVHRANRE